MCFIQAWLSLTAGDLGCIEMVCGNFAFRCQANWAGWETGKGHMFRYSLLLLALLGGTGRALASSWADGLCEEQVRDFGTVPRGPLLTHPFRVVNKTKETVHISSVRVSCGCTSARALQTTLAPGEETAILAEMDTRRFFNTKGVTIYVQFDQPG